MARTKKTWQQKLEDARAKPGLPKTWFCDKAKQSMVVASPDEIEGIIRRVKPGRLITNKQIAELLEAKHGVDQACPMTTGIFASLIAHAAHEREQEGRKRVAPWWRVLKTTGELNPKYPEEGEVQRAKLEAEGHEVVAKGKKLVVADFEARLVGSMKPEIKRGPGKVAGGIDRKVLERDDFGLCVLLPKTEWSRLPESGPAQVEIDGKRRQVTVQVEKCNCRGNGWHEHRFLSLPRAAGTGANQRVTVVI